MSLLCPQRAGSRERDRFRGLRCFLPYTSAPLRGEEVRLFGHPKQSLSIPRLFPRASHRRARREGTMPTLPPTERAAMARLCRDRRFRRFCRASGGVSGWAWPRRAPRRSRPARRGAGWPTSPPVGPGRCRAGYNPSTGFGGYRAGATTPFGSWSRGAVTNGDDWVRAGSVSGPRGTAGGVQGSGGAGLVHAENRFGNGVTVGTSRDGDVYAGKDGNIYRRTEDGWEQQTPTTPKQTTQGTGKPADRAKPDNTAATRAKPSAEQAGYLQRESAARQRGDQTAKRASSPPRSRGTGRGRAGGGR